MQTLRYQSSNARAGMKFTGSCGRHRRIARTVLCLLGVILATAPAFGAPPGKSSAATEKNQTETPRQKLHPEFSDPVLGDRAAIVEWAWSPQYAKRFGVPVQADGLKDGHLWLVGIKILRTQSGGTDFQSYQCRVAGLIDNKAPMLMPPGDRYVMHPGYHWLGGMPGRVQPYTSDLVHEVKAMGAASFTPGTATWHKRPKDERQKAFHRHAMGANYLLFHRYYTQDLAYFELEGGCAYFDNPDSFRNELRFPTETFPPGENGQIIGKTFASSALKFDLPDSLMRKLYPRIVDADDWGSCLMRRATERSKLGFLLTTRAFQTRRFGKSCEQGNPTSASTNR